MYKIFVATLALCALTSVTCDPLDDAIARAIREKQASSILISSSLSRIGYQLGAIKQDVAMVLNPIRDSAQNLGTSCARKVIYDINFIFSQFRSLELCTRKMEYNMLRSRSMQTLERQISFGYDNKESCKTEVNYEECITQAAQGIEERVTIVHTNVLETVKELESSSAECIEVTSNDMQKDVDNVGANWELCQTNP